jgi:predicted phage terminase large subunit-like protein
MNQPLDDFTVQEIDFLLENIDELDEDEQLELLAIVDILEARTEAQRCRDDLLAFCIRMQPDYKVGAHHKALAKLLMEIERGDKDRISVSVAPRHGKSQLVSIYFPAWYMGRNPTKQVMMVSHTSDLAVDFGRKVRNLIDSPAYQEIFPHVSLSTDSKSAGRWNTNRGGVYYATGVGSSIAGRGADLLVVDDAVSEQDILKGGPEALQKIYEWFAYGARTRLMPKGAVALVGCMTADTRVLMSDGSEKPICDIEIGDEIVSYDGQGFVQKRILNWINHGSDHIYAIRLNCGNLIRANERHPFLVYKEGVAEWVRLRDLRPGDELVSLRVATVSLEQEASRGDAKFARTESSVTEKLLGLNLKSLNQNLALRKDAQVSLDLRALEVSAPPVYRESTTTSKIQTRPTEDRAIGVNGGANSAQRRGAQRTLRLLDFVIPITTNFGGRRVSIETHLHRIEARILSIVTGFLSKITSACGLNKKVAARYAENHQATSTRQRLGTVDWRLTTATTQSESAPYSVTPVTSLLDLEPTRPDSSERLSIYEPTLSKISEIQLDGFEDVFDIEVEDTENFIANGVVSHNTRWHTDDLIGRVIKDMAMNELADQYEVIEFPAIMEVPDPENPELTIEKALWPEFYDLQALYRTRASMPLFQWNAQYQQNPTAEGSAIIKREWWRRWMKDEPPKCEFLIMSLDAAAETHNRADFTALTTWGVFFNEEEDTHNIILLNSIKKRYEFPELKQMCLLNYKDWEPDSFIVEKKSAGVAIYQELRRMGIPVQEYTPHRGTGDKTARLNSVTDIVSSGMVWVPETRWAEEVVEEIASFPYGSHDDLVDSTVMALMRFRQGGFLTLPSDMKEDPPEFKSRRGRYY